MSSSVRCGSKARLFRALRQRLDLAQAPKLIGRETREQEQPRKKLSYPHIIPYTSPRRTHIQRHTFLRYDSVSSYTHEPPKWAILYSTNIQIYSSLNTSSISRIRSPLNSGNRVRSQLCKMPSRSTRWRRCTGILLIRSTAS